MTNRNGKLFLMIASGNFNTSDLSSFGQWIEEFGSQEFARTIERLRKLANDEATAYSQIVEREPRQLDQSKPSDDLARHIEVLIGDTRLSKSQAASLIALELSKLDNQRIGVPNLNKMSFANWVRRLAETVSPSEILHVVTKLRNERTHASKTDWPLKK